MATSLHRDSTPLTADTLGFFNIGVLGALGYLTALLLMHMVLVLLVCLAHSGFFTALATEVANSLLSTSLYGAKGRYCVYEYGFG